MNGVSATLIKSAIEKFGESKLSHSALLIWAARQFDEDPALNDVAAAFQSQVFDRLESAQQQRDFDLALQLDGLIGIFAPENRQRLDSRVAAHRASTRCADAERALHRGELEAAAAFCLAALALDPENAVAPRRLNDAADRLSAQYQLIAQEKPTLESTIALSLAVALGVQDRRLALAKVLYDLADFSAAALLCQRIEGDVSVGFFERLDALRLRLQARHRTLGADQATAEALAAPDLRQWLRSLGPATALEDAAIRTRISCNFNDAGYRQTLADLRELRRRTPEDPWVAHCFCVILHNAAHPDVAASVDLVVRHCPDNSADLQARYILMSAIGAMPQALTLADRLTSHHPEYAVIGALHEMATDLDAAPAFIFGRARTGRRVLYANLACWGARYIDLMERGALASLLAPDNIPALAAKADIVVELFTMSADSRRLRHSPMIERLAAFCEIRIYCFPDVVAARNKSFGYATYGYALHATALRAERDGADITFLMPDLLYANGSYATVAERLTDAPRAMFFDGPNAYATSMLERMRPFRRDDVLSVSSQDLLDASMSCLSKRTFNSLYAPGDKRTCMQPTRVIFPTALGLQTHAFMMLPVYVSHAALSPFLMKNFGTQDGMMIEHILNGVEDSQIDVLSPKDFCYVEICEDDGLVRDLQDLNLTCSIRDFFARCALGRNRLRLFSRPIFLPTLAPPGVPLVSVEEADVRVREVQEMFATDPVMVDLAEEQERVRRALYR